MCFYHIFLCSEVSVLESELVQGGKWKKEISHTKVQDIALHKIIFIWLCKIFHGAIAFPDL